MEKKNQTSQEGGLGRHQHPLPQEISDNERKKAADAHHTAEEDMDNDAELSSHSPNDDLDEGESARLGEDITDLI